MSKASTLATQPTVGGTVTNKGQSVKTGVEAPKVVEQPIDYLKYASVIRQQLKPIEKILVCKWNSGEVSVHLNDHACRQFIDSKNVLPDEIITQHATADMLEALIAVPSITNGIKAAGKAISIVECDGTYCFEVVEQREVNPAILQIQSKIKGMEKSIRDMRVRQIHGLLQEYCKYHGIDDTIYIEAIPTAEDDSIGRLILKTEDDIESGYPGEISIQESLFGASATSYVDGLSTGFDDDFDDDIEDIMDDEQVANGHTFFFEELESIFGVDFLDKLGYEADYADCISSDTEWGRMFFEADMTYEQFVRQGQVATSTAVKQVIAGGASTQSKIMKADTVQQFISSGMVQPGVNFLK